MNFVTHDDLASFVPIVHVQIFLIGRKREAIGTFELRAYRLELAVDEAEDAAIRQFLARVVEELWQGKGWVGEKERAIRAIDKIVWAVQAFAFVAIRENRELAIFLKARDTTIAVLIDGDATLIVER